MSKDLIFDIKNKHYICKKCKIEIKTNHPELEDNFDLIELLMNKDDQVEINISQNSDHNSNSNDEENSKKRSNSSNHKKFHDIDEFFWKDKNLFDFLSQNIEVQKQINEELSYLLKQIFDKRYKLYPNNVCSLSEYSSHIQNKIDIYCSEDNEMSLYILYMLHSNISNLFEYVEKVVNFDSMKFEEINTFKEIMYLIGKDMKKIFKTAVNTIDKYSSFKLENVLISMFNEYLLQKNKSKGPKVIHAALINERKIFEGLIRNYNEIKFTSNIINWVNDPSDEFIEEKKVKFDEDNKINENLKNEININDENKNFINIDNAKIKINEGINSIKSSYNDLNIISKNINENDDNKNVSKIKEKEYNNKDVRKLDIEDLVSYINEPKSNANHKKKQKKKKKTKKSNKEIEKAKENNNNNNIIEENNENNINNNFDDDADIADFKKCIEDFTTHTNQFLYQKKIDPNISEDFIKKLDINYV